MIWRWKSQFAYAAHILRRNSARSRFFQHKYQRRWEQWYSSANHEQNDENEEENAEERSDEDIVSDSLWMSMSQVEFMICMFDACAKHM